MTLNVQANVLTALQPRLFYDVQLYGAAGNGNADDTAALQAAITACCNAGGGRVWIPNGNYKISGTLHVTSDNVVIEGESWSARIFAAPAFGNIPMLQVDAIGGGLFRYGIRIQELFIDGTSQAVIGINLVTTYAAVVDHCRVRFVQGAGAIGIHLSGSAGNFGAYNQILNCHITDGGAGVGLQSDFSEWFVLMGGLFSFWNGSGGIAVKCSNLNCRIVGAAFDNNDTAIDFEFAGRNTVVGCQFDRGQTRFIYLHGSSYNTITGNVFNSFNGVAAGQGAIDVTDVQNAGNVIVGNTLRGGSGWPHFILEHATVGTPVNSYADNETGGGDIVLVNGTVRNNRGVNPVGKLAVQPAVPATTVAYTNTNGYDCEVYITGGTVTVIAIGGNATGLTTGVFRVPANQTITLTYTVAPTWTWFGD